MYIIFNDFFITTLSQLYSASNTHATIPELIGLLSSNLIL